MRSEAINSCLEEKTIMWLKAFKVSSKWSSSSCMCLIHVFKWLSTEISYSLHQILFSSIFYCSKNNIAESTKETCNIFVGAYEFIMTKKGHCKS